jgi:hypothetical protein
VQVGSNTNHYQIQCFSTHLATFAGGFLVLPAPVNWNYVFANAGFAKNMTVYLTVICVCVIYLLLIIYARVQDKEDLKKVHQVFCVRIFLLFDIFSWEWHLCRIITHSINISIKSSFLRVIEKMLVPNRK